LSIQKVLKMKLSFFSAACVLSFSALLQAQAGPLVIGDLVEVTDGEVTGFPGDGDWRFTAPGGVGGLYASVSFDLKSGNSTEASSINAGRFVLDQRPWTDLGSGKFSQLLAFCLEPNVSLLTDDPILKKNDGTTAKQTFNNPYTVKSLTGAGYSAVSNNLISELWGRHYGKVNSKTTAAAFQVAVWELAYGTTDKNLADGDFKLNTLGDIMTTAQGWLSSLNGTGPMAQGLVALQDDNVNNRNNQDLLTQGQVVPEPGMLGLLAAGLVGLGLARRRTRRHSRA
jgi:hypothetical protein